MNEWDRMVMIEGQNRESTYGDLWRALGLLKRQNDRAIEQGNAVLASGVMSDDRTQAIGRLMAERCADDLRSMGTPLSSVVGLDLAKTESQSCSTWLFSDVHLSVAADRIMALINSKPRSPTKAEILDAIHGAKL